MLPSSFVTKLHTINATGMKARSPKEIAKLVNAAQNDGIFYLDLSEDKGAQSCLTNMKSLTRGLFALETRDKEYYDIDKFGELKLNGYKPIGRNVGGIKGTRDGFESYAVGQDDILSSISGHAPRPQIMEHHLPDLEHFTTTCLSLAHDILSILSDNLCLSGEHTLQLLHDIPQSESGEPSMNIVRMLKYMHCDESTLHVPQQAHTDMGSLTFLFADTPGLQILPSGSTDWLYVPPQSGMALVNIGDALSVLSSRRFHSVLHRVASLPGVGMEERYSLAFLLQPARSTIMWPLEGDPGISQGKYTCADWMKMKFEVLRGPGSNKLDYIQPGKEIHGA